jgi:hypothetical protein
MTNNPISQNKAQIIAALEQLEAARSAPENKEWLASRKEIGRQIDPEAVDVMWQFESVLDPYGLCESPPDEIYLIGREYFARSLDKEVWVSFDDLPPRTRDRLWQRMRAGHFDASDVNLTPVAAALGLNRMLCGPNRSPLVSWDRVAPRTGNRSDTPLIVKPADPESMIYMVVWAQLLRAHRSAQTAKRAPPARSHLIGWMPAQTAKRLYPLITVGSIAAHFVSPHELRAPRDLETFLRQSA